MASTPAVTGRCIPAWPKDALRISFGIIWLIDAMLKWLPGSRSGYMGMIMGRADGQPGLLRPWFRFWIDVQHTQATSFAYLVAVVEMLIAVALIAGFARKLTYISAAVFSVLIWATAEGFGGPYASGSGRHRHRGHLRGGVPWACSRSATTPARPATAPTTTWRRRSPGGGRSPRSAAPSPSRSRPPRSPR
jgi:uncharacterized membrane protein YphA (DoxX/SURF4 family)